MFRVKMKKLFKTIKEDDRLIQQCLLCKYKSGTITNSKPDEISYGMAMHFKFSHKNI